MPDVQSFYQAKQSVNPVINTAFFPFENGLRVWTDKHGAGLPSALLHLNVQGTVTNDSSYITNKFATLVVGDAGTGIILLKLDNIPDPAAITSMKLKFRWDADEEIFDGDDFFVVVFQGRPNNTVKSNLGNVGAQYWFEGVETADPTAFTRLGQVHGLGAANTFFDEELAITLASITDPDDLWVSIEADSDFDNPIIRIFWMVFEITYPYALAETPTFKNYVNDLTKITNVSARQVGTVGTTKYCYRIVPCDAAGVCGPASDEVTVTDGNATLDATNHICLTWEDDVGATNYKVYRTCGPSNLGIGLLETVLPDLNDCGSGAGGSGFTGYKDDGLDCITDCDDKFDEDALEGCQGVTTVTIGAKETPTTVTYPAKETPS